MSRAVVPLPLPAFQCCPAARPRVSPGKVECLVQYLMGFQFNVLNLLARLWQAAISGRSVHQRHLDCVCFRLGGDRRYRFKQSADSRQLHCQRIIDCTNPFFYPLSLALSQRPTHGFVRRSRCQHPGRDQLKWRDVRASAAPSCSTSSTTPSHSHHRAANRSSR